MLPVQSPQGAPTHNLREHDLSPNGVLNRLSQPGGLWVESF